MKYSQEIAEKINNAGWAIIEITENKTEKIILEKLLKNKKTFSISITYLKDGNVDDLIKSYIFDLLRKTENAEIIKESVERFKSVSKRKHYSSAAQLNKDLQLCDLKLISKDDEDYKLIAKNILGISDREMKNFHFPYGQYDTSFWSKKTVNQVCIFLKSYNAESYANHYYFISKEEDDRIKFIYDNAKEVDEELKKLFDKIS